MTSIKHTCNEACKGRATNVVICFGCQGKFYLKCFPGLNDQSIYAKINSPDSHLHFICGQCLPNPSNARRSSAKLSTSNQTQDIHQININIQAILDKLSSTTQRDDNDCFSALTKLFDNASNDLTKMITKLHSVYENTVNLAAKFNSIPTNDTLKEATANICKSIEAKLKEISNAIAEPMHYDTTMLDWTLKNDSIISISDTPQHKKPIMNISDTPKQRQSIIVKQTVDDTVMNVLKTSEETTWKSIDALRDIIMDQKHLLTSIDTRTTITQDAVSNLVSGNPFVAKDGTQKEALPTKPNENPSKQKVQKSLSTTLPDERLTDSTQRKSSQNPFRINKPQANSFTQTKPCFPAQNARQNVTQFTQRRTSANHQYTTKNRYGNQHSNEYPKTSFNEQPNFTVNLDDSDNDWTTVSHKRRRSNSFASNSFAKPRSIFWSKLSKDMNLRKASDYLISNGIVDIAEFTITCLTKGTSFGYLSYKIDTIDSAANKILMHKSWPGESYVRNYRIQKKQPRHADIARNRPNFL